MKAATYFVIFFSMCISLQATHTRGDQSASQSFTGEIMDDLCAKDKTHSKMMDQMKSMGNQASICTRKCVQLGAKYVLFDRSNDTVYPIANQEAVEPFAGRLVHVSGALEKKKLKVIQIEPSDQPAQKNK